VVAIVLGVLVLGDTIAESALAGIAWVLAPGRELLKTGELIVLAEAPEPATAPGSGQATKIGIASAFASVTSFREMGLFEVSYDAVTRRSLRVTGRIALSNAPLVPSGSARRITYALRALAQLRRRDKHAGRWPAACAHAASPTIPVMS
jgi:hypothetical protein